MRARGTGPIPWLAALAGLVMLASAVRAEPPALATVLDPAYVPTNQPCGAEPTPECIVDLARAEFDAIESEQGRLYAEAYAWAALSIAGSEASRAAARSWFATEWPFALNREKNNEYLWVLAAAAAEAGRYDQARIAARRIDTPEVRALILAHTAWREARACQVEDARRDAAGASEALANVTNPVNVVYATAQILKALGALDDRADRPELLLTMDIRINEAKSRGERDLMRTHQSYAYVWSGRDESAKSTIARIASSYREAYAFGVAARSWADLGRIEDAKMAIGAADKRFELIDDPKKIAQVRGNIAPVIVYLRGVGPALDYALGIDNPMEKARALERIVHAAWDPRDRPGSRACDQRN